MRNFCDTHFWDANVTWYTENPDFTPCFQSTLLTWLPFGVLLLFAPLELRKVSALRERSTPWGCVNISKLVLNVCLCWLFVLQEVQVLYYYATSVQPTLSEAIAPGVQLITLILVIAFTECCRQRGLRASLILPLFWFVETISMMVLMRSEVDLFIQKVKEKEILTLEVKVIINLLALLQFFLSGVVEGKETQQEDSQISCPMKNISFFSRISFLWMTSTFLKGLKGKLSQDSLLPLCQEMKCATVSKIFDKAAHYRRSRPQERYTREESTDESTRLIDSPPVEVVTVRKRRHLVWVLCKIAGFYFAMGSLFELVSIALSFVAPFVLNLLLNFIKNDELYWHGFVYAAAFYLGSLCSQMATVHSMHLNNIASVQVKSSLIDALYKKLFRVSGATRREHTSGEIVNLVAVDTEELFELIENLSQIWSIPLRIIACMYFLWIYLGPSCLVGLGIIAVLSPITFSAAKKVNSLHDRRMASKDVRMKIMNEILNGIKVLKLYGWEPPFIHRVQSVRNRELSYLITALYWNSGFVLLWVSAPLVVALSTFSVFLASDEHNVLDANTAFVTFSVFYLLRYPTGLIPDLLSRLVRARVSFYRLVKFFNSEELDPNCVGNNTSEGDAVSFDSGSFSWAPEQEATLKNLTLQIKKGSLVAVVGSVGSGKSSMLSALLGEMYKLEGHVNVQGSVAYVPQLAWIQNRTLQDNVLFTKPLLPSVYNDVLRACALEPDLEVLPGGDQTEIGEKGINLSGGQKQRVSLARAVYQDRDIYLLDDPLSAVDSHVATQLFHQVIGPYGLLSKKTRILVTHNVSVLPDMDHIVVLEGGCIAEHGTYDELTAKGDKFSEYIQQHLRQSDEKEAVEGREEGEQFDEGTLSRQQSRVSKGSDVSNVPEQDIDEDEFVRLTEEERMGHGRIHMRIYLEYIRNIGVPLFVFFIFMNVLASACELGCGVWLSQWSTDRPLPDGSQNTALRNQRIAVFGMLIVGNSFFIVTKSLLISSGGVRASRSLHHNLLQRIMKAPLYFFDTTPVGRIINRFSKDMEDVDTQIPENLKSWIASILFEPFVLVIIALNSYYILIAFLPIGIFYYYVQKLYIGTTRQLRRMTATSRSPIYSDFSESLAGVSSIRAFKAESHFVIGCQSRVDRHLNSYYVEMSANRWMECTLYLIGGLIVLAIALVAVIGRSSLDVGLMGLALAYSLEETEALGWLVRIGAHLESSVVALERIKDYMNVPQEAEWEMPERKPPTEWPQSGDVDIHDFTATYREGLDPVLKDVTIHIWARQKVGVVGRTGAGKSSLVLSIFRIIEPDTGTIIVDGADIHQMGLHDLRCKLTIIPQDPVIFAGTVRMNIDPCCDYSDSEIWSALEHAHLKTYVSTLPGKLEYELAEGGENLSAGQRQLVCLTRALLRKSRILILDEATASVDLDTDRLIQRTIRDEFAHCTIITIAHRIHTILDYDRVIVMANGEVTEDGKPAHLIQDPSSQFFAMARGAGLT